MRCLPFGCAREAGRLIIVDLQIFSIRITVSKDIAVLDTKSSLHALRMSLCGVYLLGVPARRAG